MLREMPSTDATRVESRKALSRFAPPNGLFSVTEEIFTTALSKRLHPMFGRASDLSVGLSDLRERVNAPHRLLRYAADAFFQ